MNKMFKLFSCIILLFICAGGIFAQSALRGASVPWWLSLEQGKVRFRAGEFGAALILFEDARRDRRAMYEYMERDLIAFLSMHEVRRLGDSLDRVERYSYDRHFTSASAAFEELFYRIPKASFNNSATNALNAFDGLKNYPEAEYWIGEVYRVEGELSLAMSQYQRAYSMRNYLEDSGFATTLLYKIADIMRIRQDFNEMERVYHSIINESDTLWTNSNVPRPPENQNDLPYAQASAGFARRGMRNILETNGLNSFMELFRYNNSAVELAHRQLGFYLVVRNRPADEHLMFAFLIQNTIIIEEIRRRQFDFAFTNLPALMTQINRYPMLVTYIEEVEYFKTIYYFAASLRVSNISVARILWEFLASQPQAGEWHGRAISQLRNPRPEPLAEIR